MTLRTEMKTGPGADMNSNKIALFEHFRRLLQFSGREDRASFWPYAALVFGIVMVAGFAIFVPMMEHSMRAMQEYAAQHPEQASIATGPGQYSISVHGNHPEFMPAGSMAWYLGVTFGLSVLLYAAAVARRLHDRGMSGKWGLMPLPFIIYSSVQMPRMFGSFGTETEPDMGLFFSIFISNFLYVGTLIALIVLLCRASDPTPNRYLAKRITAEKKADAGSGPA